MSGSLGDRMKAYEEHETHARFLPNVPIVARIDGRCFSKFTKQMVRPFDEQFNFMMRDVTYQLVKETGASIGYTQSDEINLCWYNPNPGADIFFGGRKFKMTAQLAALATAHFHIVCNKALLGAYVQRHVPTFDARVFQVPNLAEGANAFLWRQRDCRKNAISMAARALYSHKELLNKNGGDMLAMIATKGVDYEGYPWQFREGTFIRKEITERELTPGELASMPEDKNPGKVMRSRYVEVRLPLLSELDNPADVIFLGDEPVRSADAKILTETLDKST